MQMNKCLYSFIRLTIMKMKIRSHRYDINRPSSRHGNKCSKYKLSQYSDAFMY